MNSSNNNTITKNTANLNNYCGIHVWSSSNNTVTANTANLNDYYGIGLASSSDNLTYNNYFDNTNNAEDNGNNIWNISNLNRIRCATYTLSIACVNPLLMQYWS